MPSLNSRIEILRVGLKASLGKFPIERIDCFCECWLATEDFLDLLTIDPLTLSDGFRRLSNSSTLSEPVLYLANFIDSLRLFA